MLKFLDFKFTNIHDFISNWYLTLGVSENGTHLLTFISLIVILIAIYTLVHFVVTYILKILLNRLNKFSITKFDDLLVKNKVFINLGRLIPLIVTMNLIPLFFENYTIVNSFFNKIIDMFLVLVWVFLIRGIFRTIKDHLQSKPSFQDKPLDSYLQVANIFLYFVAGVILFTQLTGKSTLAFLGTLGAASAVLMLIFKDTILGFVASIQVSINDMVRIGDWIEMPKYNADGDVLEINLNTVKIQNWDKTITTVPTYYLITDSFKNWRGMQSSGGRRIKRSINIKISTIRHMTDGELDELSKIHLLKDFIDERRKEIKAYNERENIAHRELKINGRNLTNIGLFRQYVSAFLKHHERTNKNMTIMVRQLEPTEKGLPIELYLFTGTVAWAEYEEIASNIFDHLLATVKYFDLEVFELPASADIRSVLIEKTKAATSLPEKEE